MFDMSYRYKKYLEPDSTDDIPRRTAYTQKRRRLPLDDTADNTSTDQESDVLHSDNDVSAMRLSPQSAYHESSGETDSVHMSEEGSDMGSVMSLSQIYNNSDAESIDELILNEASTYCNDITYFL
ncbi:hypothetical protein PV327_011627 [Microctonus hyperodae]|uniref:Uncharacterized protein n=1 Tax=Microctonus hyperodae TaxID=165561 RepID=A0AA39FH51_MICHY|nr:hypothetical protein PV327_011627 [Microctonus hyperodae]